MQKNERFSIFINRLRSADPARSRDEALALMKQIMNEVEDEFSGLPRSNFADRMHIYGFDPFYGWQDLDQNPCWWDDSIAKIHRTEIYNDGRIVITRTRGQIGPVIDKSGAV